MLARSSPDGVPRTHNPAGPIRAAPCHPGYLIVVLAQRPTWSTHKPAAGRIRDGLRPPDTRQTRVGKHKMCQAMSPGQPLSPLRVFPPARESAAQPPAQKPKARRAHHAPLGLTSANGPHVVILRRHIRQRNNAPTQRQRKGIPTSRIPADLRESGRARGGELHTDKHHGRCHWAVSQPAQQRPLALSKSICY